MLEYGTVMHIALQFFVVFITIYFTINSIFLYRKDLFVILTKVIKSLYCLIRRNSKLEELLVIK